MACQARIHFRDRGSQFGRHSSAETSILRRALQGQPAGAESARRPPRHGRNKSLIKLYWHIRSDFIISAAQKHDLHQGARQHGKGLVASHP